MSRPIGLTGGIGSGKSTAAAFLAGLGAGVVDADEISRELTAAGGAALPALREAFGDRMVPPGGALDRAAMRALAFADPAARGRLEAILHPMIRDTSAARIAAAPGAYVISAVPLLVESGNWKERFDRVLVIDCPEEVQIERVMRRNGLPREQVLAILAAQATRAQRLAAADDVIDNGGTPDSLPPRIDALHRRYLALARAKAA